MSTSAESRSLYPGFGSKELTHCDRVGAADTGPNVGVIIGAATDSEPPVVASTLEGECERETRILACRARTLKKLLEAASGIEMEETCNGQARKLVLGGGLRSNSR